MENKSTQNLVERIADAIEKQKLLPGRPQIILGLSGGPDSVFLLQILVALKQRGHLQEIIAAHLDHEWRVDSKKDVLFCKVLAQEYGIPFVSDTLNHILDKNIQHGSKEEIGRKARRIFLEHVMKEYNANAIALAHHRDDQIETFFIRLIRGTSLTGLSGMRPKRGPYVRPLLALSKQEILDYLDNHQIAYLTDPSNISQDYLRNRIRMNVLPALRACDERFDINAFETILRLQQTDDYLTAHTKELFDQIRVNDSLNMEQLLAQPPTMQQRILMHWLIGLQLPFPVSQRFLDEIIRFLKSTKSKTHQLHHEWYLEKYRNLVQVKKH
jgi:tRNA(Ile)-lysidine synthase